MTKTVQRKSGSGIEQRVTIRDVARKAGVCLATASHALNPNPDSTIGVSEQTVLRVKAAARNTGYRPHAGARSIRSNRFQNIGFYVARKGVASRPPEEYLVGVFDAAQQRGYRVVLVGLENENQDYRDSVSSVFQQKSLDAIVVASYHHLSSDIHHVLSDFDLPVVYVNDRYEHNAVWLDDRTGGRIMTEHLIERGSRKIVFALPQYTRGQQLNRMHCSAADRVAGYRQAMEAAGLVPDVRLIEMPADHTQNPRILDDWLVEGQGGLPDAVFAYDDDLANDVAKMLIRKQIRVPRDIALAGYNGAYASLSAWCPLTTMRIPSFEMGRAAIEMAIKIIEDFDTTEIPSIKFRPKLILGEST